MLRCSKCKTQQNTDQFSKNDRYRTGFHPFCRSCKSEYYQSNKKRQLEQARAHKFRKLGLPLEAADELLRQNPVCQICNEGPKGRNKRLCIDHCHVTDKIRGVLCTRCNALLGWAQDDPDLLLNSYHYLAESLDTGKVQSTNSKCEEVNS